MSNEPNKEKIVRSFPDDTFYTFDGLDEAIIGVAFQAGQFLTPVYSYGKILEILEKRDGMTSDEALEYADFNIVNMYIGEKTPVILFTVENMNE
jgi:hypothetical protein